MSVPKGTSSYAQFGEAFVRFRDVFVDWKSFHSPPIERKFFHIPGNFSNARETDVQALFVRNLAGGALYGEFPLCWGVFSIWSSMLRVGRDRKAYDTHAEKSVLEDCKPDLTVCAGALAPHNVRLLIELAKSGEAFTLAKRSQSAFALERAMDAQPRLQCLYGVQSDGKSRTLRSTE